MVDHGGVVIVRSRVSWLALALGALLSTLEARADISHWTPPPGHRWLPPERDNSVPLPLRDAKVALGLPERPRWELVTLVALGVACTAGALTFAVVAWRRRRDP